MAESVVALSGGGGGSCRRALSRMVLRLLVVMTACVVWANGFAGVSKLYCGHRNCYDILGLERGATEKEIKKAYRKTAFQWHPDKTNDPRAPQIFREIAQANQVLMDPEIRAAYDYYLDNPDSMMAAYYGYRAIYPSKTSPLVVLLGVLLFLSLLQYVNQKWQYESLGRQIMNSQKFKRAVDAEMSERYTAQSRVKMDKKKLQELRAEVEKQVFSSRVQVEGGFSPPDWRNLIMVKACLLPYTLSLAAYREARWFIKFNVLGHPMGYAEKVELTKRKLGLTDLRWKDLGPEKQVELISRELWEKKKMEIYQQELKEADRDRRSQSGRFKQEKRWRKKNPDTGYMLDD